MDIERMMDVVKAKLKIVVVELGKEITLRNEWGTSASEYGDYYTIVPGFGRTIWVAGKRNSRGYGEPGESYATYRVEATPVVVKNEFHAGYAHDYRRTIRYTIYVTAEEAVELNELNEFMTVSCGN